MRDMNYYSGLVKEVFDDGGVREQIERFHKIDQMLACDYENPAELKALSWIGDRKFVSSAPADAANAATRAFASRKPILSVQPLSDHPDEYARVERLESGLMWEFDRMNSVGKKPVHWQVVESAMRYCKVALQTEYLPFTFKESEKTNRIKSILNAKKFNWIIHHPGTVFAMDGHYGVHEWVVKKSKYSVQYLIKKYGDKNNGVQKMINEFKDGEGNVGMDDEVWFFDVTSWDDRIQWAARKENGADYEFFKGEHKTPFFPWVITDNEDPILKTVIDANLWENSNAIRTIVFSKAVDMAAHPELWISTPSGDLENVHIDNTNPSQPLVTDQTTKVQQLRPPQIDQQLEGVKQSADSEIFRSSVAQVLASAEQISSTQTFSTVNAMLQAALTQLVLAQNTAERAEQKAFEQMLQWVDYADIPLTLYRDKNKTTNEVSYKSGQEIMIRGYKNEEIPEELANKITEFDPEFLYLTVKLKSTSITDKQAEQTMAINMVDRLGASKELVYEEFGYGDYSLHEARRYLEDMTDAAKQADMQREMAQVEMEVQQAQQEQQLAAEKEALASRGEGQFSGAQGVDPRQGGVPPAANSPSGTREQLSGQSQGGQGLA